jgi:hypothetical protein
MPGTKIPVRESGGNITGKRKKIGNFTGITL